MPLAAHSAPSPASMSLHIAQQHPTQSTEFEAVLVLHCKSTLHFINVDELACIGPSMKASAAAPRRQCQGNNHYSLLSAAVKVGNATYHGIALQNYKHDRRDTYAPDVAQAVGVCTLQSLGCPLHCDACLRGHPGADVQHRGEDGSKLALLQQPSQMCFTQHASSMHHQTRNAFQPIASDTVSPVSRHPTQVSYPLQGKRGTMMERKSTEGVCGRAPYCVRQQDMHRDATKKGIC